MEPSSNPPPSSTTEAPIRESAFTKVSRQLPLSPEMISLYRPLLILAAMALGIGLLAAIHVLWANSGAYGASFGVVFKRFVEIFFDRAMIVYLAVVSYLKVLDIPGFAARFRQYDIISNIFPPYAAMYPYVEVAILAMLLTGWFGWLGPVLMIAVGAVGILSVLKAQQEGKNLNCACLGTAYPIPIGKGTLIENGFMALSGVLMLIL